MKVLFAASEAHPFIKTGGLGDVMGALPKSLINLDIDARVGILTPFSAFGKDIESDVLISEAIIVGEVPDTYYNLEGMDEADDTFNFIE